jgi:hypothetical protein
LRKPGFVHGTGEIVKSVVVEQLPVVVAKAVATGLLWAFAGTVDNIATARPATKSDAVFMAVSSVIPGQQIPSRRVLRRVTILPIASGLHLKTRHCRFQIKPPRVETGQVPINERGRQLEAASLLLLGH